MFRILYCTLFLVVACQTPPDRNCKAFKTGSFTSSFEADGKLLTTSFTRFGNIEIDEFEGKKDTFNVRWINDCECVLKKVNPKNSAEERSNHIKILSTTDSSYTFEFNTIGLKGKFKGTAYKTN